MIPEIFTMATPELKPKKGEVLRAWIDFIFGYENKKGEVLDYWIAFHDSLNLPPQEFYAAVEKEVQARKIPGLGLSREGFSEAGMLSDLRVYLRFFRERLAIYTCASPFGTGYFFSCRTVYVPALVRLWHIVAALVFFALIGAILQGQLGFTYTVVALIAFLIALVGVFRNAASSARSDLDAWLLKIPIVATIYEDWFRPETYYRLDTRAVYVQRFPQLVKQLAEEISAAKGAKLVKQYQFAPVFGELYKPVPPGSPLE